MIRRKSIGKKSKSNISKVRELVFERDSNRCVVAGTPVGFNIPCAGELTIQHSVKRGMGGSALYDDPRLLRAMCAHHNSLDGSDASFNSLCMNNGWSIPRWAVVHNSPSMIPVRYEDGWYLLDDLGRQKIGDRVAFKLMANIYGENK